VRETNKTFFMNINHFNICPSCIHNSTCVLTAQKDKVWSCSEYDHTLPDETQEDTLPQPEFELELA
jgi:hypothetical protein